MAPYRLLSWVALLLGRSLANPGELLVQSQGSIQESAPTVQTKYGKYAGIHLPSYDQDAFLGVPYAQPPLGNLRFRRPLALNTSWEGVKEAKKYGSTCMQSNFQGDMSEDCLNLNVVRPSGAPKGPLPVFVVYDFSLLHDSESTDFTHQYIRWRFHSWFFIAARL